MSLPNVDVPTKAPVLQQLHDIRASCAMQQLLPCYTQVLPDAAGLGDPEGVPSGFLAVEPSRAVAPPAIAVDSSNTCAAWTKRAAWGACNSDQCHKRTK